MGIAAFLIQVGVSILRRKELRDTTGDIWGGRTLEWSTSSPPPDYNFAFTPIAHEMDAWYDMKQRGAERPVKGFVDIHMPRNTGAGFIISMLATAMGFALIWHMWWIAGLTFAATVIAAIVHTFNYDRDYHIKADAVTRTEDERTRALAAAAARTA
jgi:cytochrome o ubiquinol oxidase subunit 1